MKKRILSLFLAVVMTFSLMAAMPFSANAGGGVSARLNALRSKFPNGAFWNHQVSAQYPNTNTLEAKWNECTQDIITWTPCSAHNRVLGNGDYDCNFFDGGSQCCGFARKIFYDVFGERETSNSLLQRKDTANLAVGDFVKLTYQHYCVVLSVSGSTFTCVECNLSGDYGLAYPEYRCMIRWDFTYNKNQIQYFVHSNNWDKVNNSDCTFDVNAYADGAKTEEKCTFDVYINGSLAANDVKDFYKVGAYAKGTTYKVDDIKPIGCYRCKGSTSFSGTINADTTVDINLETYHPPKTVAGKAATCTEAGITEGTVCSKCSKVLTAQTTVPAKGHDFVSVVTEATCITAGYTTYTCKRCSYTYKEGGEFSEWTTVKPTGVDESLIETQVQYRYSDYKTVTTDKSSLSGYTLVKSDWKQTGSGTIQYVSSFPGGFNTGHSLYAQYHKTPKTASETADKKVTVTNSTAGYIYWHWCRGNYYNGPIDRVISDCWENAYQAFSAFFSTTNAGTVDPYGKNLANYSTYYFANGSVCADSYWWYRIPVNQQKWTEYTKEYTFAGWSEWSEWSTKSATASDTRKVETRTVYRTSQTAGHSWDSGVESPKATCTADGLITYTCTKCRTTKTETVKAPGHNYVSGKCTRCGDVLLTPHTHDFSAKDTSAAYLCSAATCTEAAVYYYKCSGCEEKGTQTFRSGSPAGHKESAWITDKAATATEDGSRHKECTVCHATLNTEVIPKTGVHYETDAAIVMSSAKTAAGKEITLTMSVRNNPGISGLSVSLSYDTSVLTLKEAKNGTLFSGFTSGKNYVFDNGSDVTADGKLAEFIFTVSDSAPSEDYGVNVIVRSCVNADYDNVPINVENGIVTVGGFVYGDASGDGSIDMKDVVALRRYLAEYDYETETSSVEVAEGADANADGVIDMKDVVLLRKYLANYDYETDTSTEVLGPQ